MLDDMRGARKRRVGCFLVPFEMDEADIVGTIVPDQRCPRLCGIAGGCDRRQRLVIDLDQLRGIDRLIVIFRNDEGDVVADHAHAVLGQRRITRPIAGHAVAALQSAGHRQIAEAGGFILGAGQHREHAGRALGFGNIDRADARMGMRRAQHTAEGHAGKHHVSDIASVALNQPRIFKSRNGLAYREFTHQNSPITCLAQRRGGMPKRNGW